MSLQLTHKHLGVFLTARGFDWQQVELTAKKAKRTLVLLRQFCDTWKTPVKIQLIKAFVLPLIRYAAPLMVAACSKSLANHYLLLNIIRRWSLLMTTVVFVF